MHRFVQAFHDYSDVARLLVREAARDTDRLAEIVGCLAAANKAVAPFLTAQHERGRLLGFDVDAFFFVLLLNGAVPFALPTLVGPVDGFAGGAGSARRPAGWDAAVEMRRDGPARAAAPRMPHRVPGIHACESASRLPLTVGPIELPVPLLREARCQRPRQTLCSVALQGPIALRSCFRSAGSSDTSVDHEGTQIRLGSETGRHVPTQGVSAAARRPNASDEEWGMFPDPASTRSG